ncbi:MAG TPA: twin-arginine translocase subunit TatC [Polyangiaceae bacterium]
MSSVPYKQLIEYFRYFVVVVFIVTALITPPDPVSQLRLALPLCALYGVAILVAYLMRRPNGS